MTTEIVFTSTLLESIFTKKINYIILKFEITSNGVKFY
jgi:hypothetical protein